MIPFVKQPAITVFFLSFLYLCWHPYVSIPALLYSLLFTVIFGFITFTIQAYKKEAQKPLEYTAYGALIICHLAIIFEVVEYGIPPSASVLWLCMVCTWIMMPWPGDRRYED